MTNNLLWIIAKLLVMLVRVVGNPKSYTFIAPDELQHLENVLNNLKDM